MSSTIIEQSVYFPKTDINSFKVKSPRVVLSIFVPIGENGIISLVDSFQSRNDVKIEETDLYYFIRCLYKDLEITFYSRGLITIARSSSETKLGYLIKEARSLKTSHHQILSSLLTDYQLSLIETFDSLDSIPVHLIIVFDEFDELTQYSLTSIDDPEDPERNVGQRIVESIYQNEIVKDFIGILRSIHSRSYEDVIIGTDGSIIRSEQIGVLLSYHAYIRALHLFLRKFNTTTSTICGILNNEMASLEKLDKKFHEEAKAKESFEVKLASLFSSSPVHAELREARSRVISQVKDLQLIPVVTKFVQDSIDFTQKKYLAEREKNNIKENALHIRKILGVLEGRAKHLTLVAENLHARGTTLLAKLELFDSEILHSLSHKFEIMSIAIAFLGIIVACIGIPLALLALLV